MISTEKKLRDAVNDVIVWCELRKKGAMKKPPQEHLNMVQTKLRTALRMSKPVPPRVRESYVPLGPPPKGAFGPESEPTGFEDVDHDG